MNERSPGRCPEHDLALSPTGQCVMCRRSLAPPAEAGLGRSWTGPIVAVAVVLVAGVVGVRMLVSAPAAAPAPPRIEPVVQVAAPRTAEPEPERSPRTRTRWATTPRPDREEPSAVPEAAPRPEPSSPDPAHVLAATRRRVSITMYSASWCPSCRRAEAYLREHHIRYTERDLDVARNSERLHELNPAHTIPTFEIDDLVVVGFGPSMLEAAIDQAATARMH